MRIKYTVKTDDAFKKCLRFMRDKYREEFKEYLAEKSIDFYKLIDDF
jgi:hypothetical protein